MKKRILSIITILGVGVSFCSADYIFDNLNANFFMNSSSFSNSYDNNLFFTGLSDSELISINQVCFNFRNLVNPNYFTGRPSNRFGSLLYYGTGLDSYNILTGSVDNMVISCYSSRGNSTSLTTCPDGDSTIYQGYMSFCYNLSGFVINSTDKFYYSYNLKKFNGSFGTPYNYFYNDNNLNVSNVLFSDNFPNSSYDGYSFVDVSGIGVHIAHDSYTSTYNNYPFRLSSLTFSIIQTNPKFKVNYGNTIYEYELDSDLSIYLKSPVIQSGNTFTYAGSTGLNLFYNGTSQRYSKSNLYLDSMYWFNNNIFTPICL